MVSEQWERSDIATHLGQNLPRTQPAGFRVELPNIREIGKVGRIETYERLLRPRGRRGL
jgi:hypothetical protein